MSISVDASATFENGFVDILTLNTNVPAGTDFLLLSIHIDGQGGANPVDGTPTWNTTEDFIKIVGVQGSGNTGVELWYLLNPTSGTHDVVVNFTASQNHALGLRSMSGADTGDPIGDIPTAQTGSGTTDTLDFDSDTDNSVLFDAFTSQDGVGNPLAPTTPQVEQYEIASLGPGPGGAKVTGAGSSKTTTTAGVTTMIYTSTDSVDYAYAGFELHELAAVEIHQDEVTAGVHQKEVVAGVHQKDVNG